MGIEVSVILPTFHRERYFDECLRNLLAQDFPRDCYELVVVENGTSCYAADLVARHIGAGAAANVKVVREPRVGLVYARHTGACHACGELLIFGDDDARYEQNWISAIVDVYRADSSVGAVGTRIEVEWDGVPDPFVRNFEPMLGKLDYGQQTLKKVGLYINGGSFSIRRDLLFKLGGFNPGQVGDYIVGDSEVGLCEKLAKDGIVVAWTSGTVMWHRQEVARHGTLSDLLRRCHNSGVCTAYRYTHGSLKGKYIKLSRYILRNIFELIKMKFRIKYKKHDIENYYMLKKMGVVTLIKYIFYYTFDNELVKCVRTDEWILDGNYCAPPIIYEHAIERPTI